MNLVLIAQGYIIVTVHLISIANGLQCLECQDIPHPEECRVTTTCSSNSKCYVEQVVTSGGSVLYSTGCISESRCMSKRSNGLEMINKRQETVSKTDLAMCIDCCDGDFCNIEGCRQTATKPPQRPPLCFTCSNQLGPNSCREVTLCDPEHMCALHQSLSNSADWKSECMRKPQCSVLSQVSLTNSDGRCFTCCQEDFCNNNCNKNGTSSTTSLAPASATTRILSSMFTFTENPIVIPTKGSTENTIRTLSAVLTSSTFNENTTETSKYTTLSKPIPSSTVANSVSLQYKTTNAPTNPRVDTATPMTSTYSNITAYNLHSTDSTQTSTKSDISSSHAGSTSAEFLTSVTLNNTNRTVKGYDLSTPQTSSIGTITSSFETSNGLTSTMSVQTPVSLTYNVTSSSKTTLFYNSTPKNISTSTRKPFMLPTGCNNKTLDICFVIDSSGSFGPKGFAMELQFVKNIIHTIASETTADAEFCVLSFSTKAHAFVKLQHFSTVEEVLEAVEKIPFSTGESYMEHGLKKALHEFGNFGRHGAESDVILVTDGKSINPAKTSHAANNLKRYGSDIYAVGVGAQTRNGELANIVSNPSHLIEVQDIDHLQGSHINILQTLCKITNENGTENSTSVTNRTPTMTQTTQIFLGTTTAKQSYTILSNTGNGTANSTTVTNRPSTLKQTTQISIDTTTAKPPYTFPPNTENGTENSTTVTNRPPTVTQTTKVSSGTSTIKQPYTIMPSTENGTENSTSVTNRLPTVTQTTQISLGTTTAKQPYTILPNTENGTANSTAVTNRPPTLKQTSQIPIRTTTAKPPYTIPPKTENGTENSTSVTNIPPTMTQTTQISLETSTAKQPYTILPNTENGAVNSTIVTNIPPTVKQITEVSIGTTTAKQPYTIPPKTETGTVTANSTTVTNRSPTLKQTTKISIQTTTAKPPYTIPPKTVMCAMCSGPDFLCEKLYEIKPCEPPNNYCINKLENHKDGSRKVTRQCGDFQTCYRDWFLGSSDNDKCRNFDENNIVTLEYQCTYCCIHDNCSVPIRPADASLYKDL